MKRRVALLSAQGPDMQKHVAPAIAAGPLALHLIGDEEADKLQTSNNLPENFSQNQGLKPMRGLDGDGKVGGSNETEGRASARPRTCRSMSLRLLQAIESQVSDPLLFPEQSIG
jgi:hypothetical protein